jgi:putative aminopeptidase FrvX
MLSNPRVVDWKICTADMAKISCQFEVSHLGNTDAHPIQITRTDVSGGMIIHSLPPRPYRTRNG